MRPIDLLGRVAGLALAPLTGLGSTLRRARLFHPEGHLFRANVRPLPGGGALAERLAGEALVRLSAAVWRGQREWLDILGCAVRFRSEPIPSVVPAVGDQDLLFATIRTPLTTLLAPLSTDPHDFLQNDYYAVSPFLADGRRLKFRLVSEKVRLPGLDRSMRLHRAVEQHLAHLRLEAKPRGGRWSPLAALDLLESLDLDQEALRFDAFRAGRGIHPTGFVQNLRPAAYAASQRRRPASTAEQTHGAVRKRRFSPIPVQMHPAGQPEAPWHGAPPHRPEGQDVTPLHPPPA